jgi:cytochrome c peroxidase
MVMTTTNKALIAFALLLMVTIVAAASPRGDRWTSDEVALLVTSSLRELGPLPEDPTNRVADDPRAAEFGRKLFFDTRLSANGQVSCATCHIPEKGFQDGTPLAQGIGVTNRRTMPIAGMAHSPFLFWDGRKDSLWAQALGPLESPVEHGGRITRGSSARCRRSRHATTRPRCS